MIEAAFGLPFFVGAVGDLFTLRDLLTAFAHPSPPAAGRCKTQ